MAIGFAMRAIARRMRRVAVAPAGARLDFSSILAGVLVALVGEDF